MFCKFCGKEIREDAKFCSVCGEKLVETTLEKKIETPKIVTAPKRNQKSMRLIGGVAVLILVIIAFMFRGDSIEGKWYLVSELSSENPPAYEFNFMKDGSFIKNGSVGATYSVDNGELLLQYNALVGSRAFEYVIKGGKLYLYDGEKVFVYSRIEN